MRRQSFMALVLEMKNADERGFVFSQHSPLAMPHALQLQRATDAEKVSIRALQLENRRLRQNIAELLSEHARLNELIEVDALTGVLNRRGLNRFLAQAVAHIRRYRQFPGELSICVLLVDLDGLKAVNDQMGHATGDAVLVDVARRITQLIRPDDAIGRLGGDEFVVVLWNISATDVVGKIEKFDEEVVEIANRHNVSGALHGASIGLTWLDPEDDPRAAIERADKAMYAVKRIRRAVRARRRCDTGSAAKAGLND